jgi:hypothetical protein
MASVSDEKSFSSGTGSQSSSWSRCHNCDQVEASAQDVIEYAKYIGIDPLKEPYLLRIAGVNAVATRRFVLPLFSENRENT